MTKAVNPFKPTAGMNPPELIGRDTVLDDFAEALENGPGAPERLKRISLMHWATLHAKKDSRSLTLPPMLVFAIESSRLCSETFVLNQSRFPHRF